MTKHFQPLNTLLPPNLQVEEKQKNRICKGPRRVVCFCILSVLIPSLLISIPLLMRFVVCGSSSYILSASDMLILDQKISTIWCQGETVKMNASFTAYLTQGDPQLIKSSKPLVIEKTIIVPDDHKEYWGFYLLKGSTFQLSSCAKFKGATVLVVQGRTHLHDCAYIGEEDSAGNSDEISESSSNERLPAHSIRNYNGSASLEDLNHLLKQIRIYIKTHPRGYEHLQRNIFGIFRNTKLNQTMHLQFTNHTGTIENSNGRNRRSTPNTESISPDETGTIYTEIRHRNPKFPPDADAAYEEDVEYKEEVKSSSNGTNSSSPLSIWTQHKTGIFNFTTIDDGSDSESESSFSSSEEALARCKGIIGIFSLNRTETCGNNGFNFQFNQIIEESGFYYFIFGSENEKTSNLIEINLMLERFEYDLPIPLTKCDLVRKCEVNFSFGSSEKLVVSVPPANPNGAIDDIYLVETDCIPRMSIYLIFVLLLPIIILIFAFQ